MKGTSGGDPEELSVQFNDERKCSGYYGTRSNRRVSRATRYDYMINEQQLYQDIQVPNMPHQDIRVKPCHDIEVRLCRIATFRLRICRIIMFMVQNAVS